MVRQVVVVLDRVEGGGFAVQAEVVDGHGVGEEGLDCCEEVSGGQRTKERDIEGKRIVPSTMPRPERRMGTREMVPGRTWLVW